MEAFGTFVFFVGCIAAIASLFVNALQPDYVDVAEYECLKKKEEYTHVEFVDCFEKKKQEWRQLGFFTSD